MSEQKSYSAFAGFRRVATGSLESVVREIKKSGAPMDGTILIFDNGDGRQVDLDLRGSPEEVVQRFRSSTEKKGRGRPKMGVSCNELCLLPRHWEWLAAQPRSASATVRRLIDAARKNESPEDQKRERVDALGAFMWAVTGDLPGFEEASRQLYRGNREAFRERIADWPEDVRLHIEERLAEIPE